MPPPRVLPCKHNAGWYSKERQRIYISRNQKVRIGFDPKNKITMRCNAGCDVKRNVYISGKVIKYGKLKISKFSGKIY